MVTLHNLICNDDCTEAVIIVSRRKGAKFSCVLVALSGWVLADKINNVILTFDATNYKQQNPKQ